MKLFFSLALIFFLLAVGVELLGSAISDIGLSEWGRMPVSQKAEVMLRTKADANKSKECSEDYVHIQTLISLTAPLTREENEELVKDAVAILQKHPEWKIFPLPVQTSVIAKEQPLNTKTFPTSPEIGKPATDSKNIQVVINPLPTADKITTEEEQQENFKKVFQKYNDQKKLVVKVPPERSNKKLRENDSEKKLFTDGNFPAGEYYEIERLDELPFKKEYSSTYYFIGQVIIDYPFNEGYICQLNESTIDTAKNFFLDKTRQFQVRFPFSTSYLRKGCTVFFSLTHPLTIKGKVSYKDTTGETITKYICEYQGKSIHAVK